MQTQTPDQQLYQAVLCGDAAAAMRLLDAGADVHTLNAEGNTLLHAAVLRERPGLVRLLLDRGADPDRLNARALSPIYTTLAKDRRLLRLDEFSLADSNLGVLLDAGADPNAGQSFAHTLFHIFDLKPYHGTHRKNFYHEVLTALLAAGLDPDRQDAIGQTFLHHACLMEKPKPDPIIRLLLKHGADASVMDNTGCNPLHAYVSTANLKVLNYQTCEALVAAGAAPGAQDANGRTALHCATSTFITMMTGLYRFKEIVRSLIKCGFDPSAKDRFGDTPLDMVREQPVFDQDPTEHVYYDLLRQWLHKKDNPDDIDIPRKPTERKIIMDAACSSILPKSSYQIQDKLNKWGADILDNEGNSLLQNAITHHLEKNTTDFTFIRSIIDSGADVNARTRSGTTPLMTAVKIGTPEFVEYLIYAGADVHLANLDGQTALHLAAHKTRGYYDDSNDMLASALKMVQMLLQAGADVHATDDAGCTPLHLANHNISVCSALLDAGAKPDRQNDTGHTPLHHDRNLNYKGAPNDSCRLLLDAGAGQDKININGDLPLMSNIYLAEEYEELDSIGAMLGANDINALNYHGVSALMKAVSLQTVSSTGLVDFFLKSGVDPNAGHCTVHGMYAHPDDNTVWSRTGFMLKPPGKRALLQRLLDAGLDPASPDPDSGNTLLHSLCRDGAPTPDTDLLLDHGADANARNARGETPLLLACRRDGTLSLSASLIRTLVEHQADPNLCDQAGHTAMHYLEQTCGGPAKVPDNIRDLLLNYGAEPATASGQTVTDPEPTVPVNQLSRNAA